ncbi:TonB-dependent receptor [Anaerosinus massiliensis]|uniref:TonB-dependent receptor n=1 Tax=Massilibacillus massiliensis TaxID=1806837 RepID=UPI000DA626FC|nr:TonB-dependent receptor [Massilibacillus massiliensis]
MCEKLKKIVIPSVLCACLASSWSSASAEQAEEIVLEGIEVHSTSLEDYQVTTEVITAEKIKEMGANDLAEILESVPGLYMARADKASRLVRIRGAATDQAKVYIDGMPVFPLSGIASNSASDLSTISVQNIEKIEIIKGPGPVQYGTDYKGGVILITTKDGTGASQLNLSVAAGSDHAINHAVSYSGRDENASYYIAAGKKQGDGYLNNAEFDTEYFNGKVKWDLEHDAHLTVSGYYMNTDREIPNGIDQKTGQELSKNIKWSGDQAINGERDTKDWKYKNFKQTDIGIAYDQKVNDRFKYDIKFYHVTDGNDLWVYNGNNAKTGTNTAKNPIWYSSTWTSKGNGIEFTGDFQADSNQTFTFGTKLNKIDWESSDVLGDSDGGSDKRIGYFIQDAINLDEKTDLTMGMRYDQVKQTFRAYKDTKEHTIDPVLNLIHRFDEKDTMRFSAGKTHNFATAKQLTGNLKSGAALPDTEKATNFEIGWKHAFDEKSSVDVAVFKNNIDNRIDKITDNANPMKGSYYNIFKTDIKGMELAYNRIFNPRLKGFVNYTYLSAKDTDEMGQRSDASGLPDHMFNYGLTYTVDKFQTTLVGHFLGDVPTSDKTYQKLDSYHTVDLNFNYRQNETMDYFLQINNIFDTEYWETYEYPGDGIHFMAGVNMKF